MPAAVVFFQHFLMAHHDGVIEIAGAFRTFEDAGLTLDAGAADFFDVLGRNIAHGTDSCTDVAVSAFRQVKLWSGFEELRRLSFPGQWRVIGTYRVVSGDSQ